MPASRIVHDEGMMIMMMGVNFGFSKFTSDVPHGQPVAIRDWLVTRRHIHLKQLQ